MLEVIFCHSMNIWQKNYWLIKITFSILWPSFLLPGAGTRSAQPDVHSQCSLCTTLLCWFPGTTTVPQHLQVPRPTFFPKISPIPYLSGTGALPTRSGGKDFSNTLHNSIRQLVFPPRALPTTSSPSLRSHCFLSYD